MFVDGTEIVYLPLFLRKHERQLGSINREPPRWNIWLYLTYADPIIHQSQWITRGSLDRDLWWIKKSKERSNSSVNSDCNKVRTRESAKWSQYFTQACARPPQIYTRAHIHVPNPPARSCWTTGALPLRVMNTSAHLFLRRNFPGLWSPLPRFRPGHDRCVPYINSLNSMRCGGNPSKLSRF